MELDYVHRGKTQSSKRVEEVAKAVKESPKSEMLFRVDEVKVKGTFGLKNAITNPPYYVYLSEADFHLTNLSNKFSQGIAEASLSGKFMGSGQTSASATFRSEVNGPDLDLRIRIDDTSLKDMNDLFRAYGKFDVSEGMFSFVSDLQIRNRQISGYIKPFFKDMKVYDRRDDREKSKFRKLYEMLVGGVGKLLESKRTGEVAARADISGPVEDPEISSWQVLGSIVENAFFRTILPQFDREVTKKKKEQD